jgi:hypothetical protein
VNVIAWLDTAVRWFLAFPHWLEYVGIGWVVYSIMLHQKKVHAQNYRGVLITTLTLWPIGLALQVLEWLHLIAVWLTDDRHGPFAAMSETWRRAFSRWSVKRDIISTRE